MHALFFEVRLKSGHLPHYFEHVARLRPVLEQHTGLKFLDRYTALDDSDLLLSHQLWESEDAIIKWRKDATHRRSQSAGRQVHFADYRIRVGARVLHWTSAQQNPQPPAGIGDDDTYVVAFYSTETVVAPACASFESVNTEGKFIALAGADNYTAARHLLDKNLDAPGLDEAAIYSIRRDYGQFDRGQAPT
ncbi:MAG: antibiotic biosynthesis monooxygenase [Roseobacter sp.]